VVVGADLTRASLELGHGAATRFGVGRWGPFDAIASGLFVPQLVRRIARATSYVRYAIPWDCMDLTDPEHPRVTCAERDLPRSSDG